MSGKFTDLEIRILKEGKMEVLKPFTYMCADKVTHITVPSGFISDGTSIKALRNYGFFAIHSMLVGYGTKAAVIHDWLYRYAPNGITREYADKVFKEALRADGVSKWRTELFYQGVRLFAWAAWNEYRH